MARKFPISEEDFAENLVHVSPVADRIRLVALDQTGVLAAAKERQLQRQLALKMARLGKDAPEVHDLQERLRVQRVLRTQVQAETERAETVPPERRPDRFILHGRVVDRNRVGQEGLTVSVVDRQGQPGPFTYSEARGYFKLAIPVRHQDDVDQARTNELFLQVSDKSQAILFRGQEAFAPTAGRVVYREIVLGDLREEPCPPPPGAEPKPETTDPDVWMIRGRVVDAEQRPVRGMLVSLYDQDLLFTDSLGSTLTDDSGNFRILYRAEAFRDLFEQKPDLYVRVLDQHGAVLYSSQEAIRPNASRVEEFQITLSEKMDTGER